MTKLFLKNLKKGIKKTDISTIAGLWEHMRSAERTDITILCERKGIACSLHNIREILSENESLLKAVYNYADAAEQRDLEILALR
jgi:hypothetical protein